MKNNDCENGNCFERFNEFFECPACGNHVCKTKAELWGRVCPNCFSKLYRIS